MGLVLRPSLRASLAGRGLACRVMADPGVKISPLAGLVIGAAASGLAAARAGLAVPAGWAVAAVALLPPASRPPASRAMLPRPLASSRRRDLRSGCRIRILLQGLSCSWPGPPARDGRRWARARPGLVAAPWRGDRLPRRRRPGRALSCGKRFRARSLGLPFTGVKRPRNVIWRGDYCAWRPVGCRSPLSGAGHVSPQAPHLREGGHGRQPQAGFTPIPYGGPVPGGPSPNVGKMVRSV